MSKKLVDKLFIKETNDLSELKIIYSREQLCQFNCSYCGKIVNQRLRNINLLCKDCKTKQFCLIKYGVDNPSKDPKIIEKIKQKNKAALPETREKYRKTCLEKYGVENLFQSEQIKNKIKETLLNKYGVEHPLQSKEFKEKFKKTCNERFGVDYPSQNPEVRKSIARRYTYKNIPFDSSWELAYYIFLEDNNISFQYQPKTEFWYYVNGKKHKYNPDFIVNEKIIEIKGDQFFKFQTPKFKEKLKLMKSLGVVILLKKDISPYLNYVKDTYGRNYLKSFRNLKRK